MFATGEWFSPDWPGYDRTQVDLFLEVANIRLAAMERKDAVKVTVVYESMFGSTRKVAEAISDGVREADPDAGVECVAVGRAAAELIYSTDLLIVGGPTHLRRMTTDFSRKRQISREKKAKPKAGPRTSSNLMRRDRVCANGSTRCQAKRVASSRPQRHAAAFDTRVGSVLSPLAAHAMGLPASCVGTVMSW